MSHNSFAMLARRVGAFLVDYFIMALILQIIILGFGAEHFSLLFENHKFHWTNFFNFLLLEVVVTQVYFTFFYRRQGRSPGKVLFRLKINWNQPSTQLRIFYREVIGKIFLAPLACMNFFLYCLNKKGRLIHDYLGSTVVLAK